VDDLEFTLVVQSRQLPRIRSAKDRRLLLGMSLRLLTYRHDAGIRISHADLTRVARLFADDAEPESVECFQVVPENGSAPGP